MTAAERMIMFDKSNDLYYNNSVNHHWMIIVFHLVTP